MEKPRKSRLLQSRTKCEKKILLYEIACCIKRIGMRFVVKHGFAYCSDSFLPRNLSLYNGGLASVDVIYSKLDTCYFSDLNI